MEERVGGDPTETHAWGEDLGEAVDTHHAAVGVEREEGCREGCGERGGRMVRRVVLQEVVRVVLDDNEVEPLGNRVDLLPTIEAQR